MIQPHELRIGNLIFDDDGALCKIIGFQPYGHSVRCDESEGCDILIDIYAADGKIRKGFSVESTLVNPIPLTPELLEKCGFVYGPFVYADGSTGDGFIKGMFIISELQISNEFDGYGAEYFPYPQSHNCLPGTMKYLYQLQNNYFWWTGEELLVKL